MLVPMAPVSILAPRAQLPQVIAELHRQGTVHLTGAARQDLGMAAAGPGPAEAARITELSTEAADLGLLVGLARTAAAVVAEADWLRPAPAAGAAHWQRSPGLAPLLSRIESLQAEHEAAVRYRETLAALLPVEPELALLSDGDLARLNLAIVVLVLDAPHAGVLDGIRRVLGEVAGEPGSGGAGR
jgi:hypothetical protein